MATFRDPWHIGQVATLLQVAEATGQSARNYDPKSSWPRGRQSGHNAPVPRGVRHLHGGGKRLQKKDFVLAEHLATRHNRSRYSSGAAGSGSSAVWAKY